jgi:acyl carrier protein
MNNALKQQIAEELEVSSDELVSSTVLRDLEYWDSVTALTIMTLIDMSIGARISPDEFSEVQTFGDIEAIVENTSSSA